FLRVIEPYETVYHRKIPVSLQLVSDKILSLAEQCIETNMTKWSKGYTTLPLDLIDDPQHPLCERLGSLIHSNLHFYLDQMTDEGIWEVTWNWGGDEDHFATARTHWQGIIAVNRYKQLRAFGCME